MNNNIILRKYMRLQPQSKILKLRPNMGIGDLLICLSYIRQNYDKYDKFQIVFDFNILLELRNNSDLIKNFTEDLINIWFDDPKIEILNSLDYIDYWDQIENYSEISDSYLRPVKLNTIFDMPYVCICTKVRRETYDHYLSCKNKFLESLNILSKNFNIVIMGERNISYNKEMELVKFSDSEDIFSIYDDLINGIEKTKIIDLSRNDLTHANNISDFYKDAFILKNSEFTTFFGGAGISFISMFYSKKIIGYRSYSIKDSDNYITGKFINDENLFLTNDIDIYCEKLKNYK